MIKELWHSFPHDLERKINGLLDDAEPTPAKAFQLYKTCQREELWKDTFEKFSERLNSYFAMPRADRHKSDLDALFERPVDSVTYDEFQLNFRNALVNGQEVQNLVSWAHNLMRVSLKTTSVIISSDVISKTLNYITHPPLFEKAQDITFEDFCDAWKKIVFNLFGKNHEAELEKILNELHWLNTQFKQAEESAARAPFFPTIYLTQTEIDWISAVEAAVTKSAPAPRFPLSRGAEKQRLVELERALRLYKVVQTSKLPEFIQHRENIRVTILDRCSSLLKERAR
ncbi:MAG: hypothetical protein HUU57_10870 [Bdellovibrio sp.]|nr:hypothetical protein [Bdellovibrio sp.]